MNFFSFQYPIATALSKEAVITRLRLLERANRRYGFYFKYRYQEGQHWLEPKYVVWSRRLPIDVEVLLQEKAEGIEMMLHFSIATYFKALVLFGVVLFTGLNIYLWFFQHDEVSFHVWIFLAWPFILFVVSWAQFSTQVSDYLKAFKEAWAFAEMEVE